MVFVTSTAYLPARFVESTFELTGFVVAFGGAVHEYERLAVAVEIVGVNVACDDAQLITETGGGGSFKIGTTLSSPTSATVTDVHPLFRSLAVRVYVPGCNAV